MLIGPTGDALASWRECRDCGLLQRLPPVPDGEAASCARCGALLRRAGAASMTFARVNLLVSALLLLLALNLPFFELRVLGRLSTSTLLTGPRMLAQRGLPALAVGVVVTLVVAPAVKLAIELTVLFGVLAHRPARWLPWLFGCLEKVSPWAMVEVFLLGAFVAYTRLRTLATVDVGPATVALAALMLSMVATDATLDREAVWSELEAKLRCAPDARTARNSPPSGDPGASVGPARHLGCDICGRVVTARAGDRCPRCAHRLFFRKSGSLSRVWALLVAATLLYIPANVLPVMTVERFGEGGPSTIVHGVIELAANHMWPLALLIFLASVVIPIIKLVSLVVMLVLTHRRSSARLEGRARLFRLVHGIGRWSMVDVFGLATLVGVVRLGFLATILPGLGAVAFCAVVLITVAATELFDPRLMWDAAGFDGESREREAARP